MTKLLSFDQENISIGQKRRYVKQTTDQLLRSGYEAIPRIWLVNDDVVIAVSWIRMNDESHGKNDPRGGHFSRMFSSFMHIHETIRRREC